MKLKHTCEVTISKTYFWVKGDFKDPPFYVRGTQKIVTYVKEAMISDLLLTYNYMTSTRNMKKVI